MARKTQSINHHEKCERCNDRGMIRCPNHVLGADGWCATCDTASRTPGRVNCPCLDGN